MFPGSLVAIVTPFNGKEHVDRLALEQFIDWQIHEGTEGIVCCGTTGEGTLLSDKERALVIETCVAVADKRVPVLAGTGAMSTKETVRLTEQAAELGVDGCLVVTPYYVRPSQEGLRLHYQEVMKVGVPIVGYNNPSRAGVKLESGMGLAAVKDSGPVQKWSVPLICGEDGQLLESVRAGAIGAISVIGNVIPRQWRLLVDLALQGEWVEAEARMAQYQELLGALYQTTNPQCVKALLNWMGKMTSPLRMPLVMPPPAVEARLYLAFVRQFLPTFKRVRQSV